MGAIRTYFDLSHLEISILRVFDFPCVDSAANPSLGSGLSELMDKCRPFFGISFKVLTSCFVSNSTINSSL